MTGENLGQGSRSAGTICSMSLSKSVSYFFEDSKNEVNYGSVALSPILFQDDGLRITTSIEGARDGLRRFENVMDSKTLNVNTDKSIYLLAGRTKNVDRIRNELKSNPLCFQGSVLREKQVKNWLGEMTRVLGNKSDFSNNK